MTPSDQQQVVGVAGTYGNHYTVKFLQELNSSCQIPFSSVQNIRVCVLVAKEHPEIAEFGHGTSAISAAAAAGASADPDIKAAAANINIKKCLSSFQIVLKSMTSSTSTNMYLFAHMIMHCNENVDKSYSGSNHLGLEIYCWELECVRPTEKYLHIVHAMGGSTGYIAMRKIANRKLTTLGLAQGHCGVENSKDKMKRMTQELELSASIAKVHKYDKDASKKKKEAQG